MQSKLFGTSVVLKKALKIGLVILGACSLGVVNLPASPLFGSFNISGTITVTQDAGTGLGHITWKSDLGPGFTADMFTLTASNLNDGAVVNENGQNQIMDLANNVAPVDGAGFANLDFINFSYGRIAESRHRLYQHRSVHRRTWKLLRPRHGGQCWPILHASGFAVRLYQFGGKHIVGLVHVSRSHPGAWRYGSEPLDWTILDQLQPEFPVRPCALPGARWSRQCEQLLCGNDHDYSQSSPGAGIADHDRNGFDRARLITPPSSVEVVQTG